MNGTFYDTNENITDRDYIIIVEGVDDAVFFEFILTEMNVAPQLVSIFIASGKDKIENALRPLLKSHAFSSGRIKGYAIVRDADNDPVRTLQEMQAMFGRLSEPKPGTGQIVKRGDGRKSGLFLLPNPLEAGDLEDLCLRSAANQAVVDLASQFILSGAERGGVVDHQSKRTAQAYLATMASPLCAGVGRAMHTGVFDAGSVHLNNIKQFLQSLINDP